MIFKYIASNPKTENRAIYVDELVNYLIEKGILHSNVSKMNEDLIFLVKDKLVLGILIADDDDYIKVGYLSKESSKDESRFYFYINAGTLKSCFNVEEIFKFIENTEQGIKKFFSPKAIEECEFDNPYEVMIKYLRMHANNMEEP